MPFITEFGGQWQANLCELKASQVYIVSSRKTPLQRETIFKKGKTTWTAMWQPAPWSPGSGRQRQEFKVILRYIKNSRPGGGGARL